MINSLLYKFIYNRAKNKFLFILSPPYCGSTLLNEILCTSRNVSVNNIQGNREGQGLPLVREIMFNHDRRWDESLDFDWEFIKNEWMKYWDCDSPILLEKSPPNIIRAHSIKKHFTPSFFIILYRNPYAHCESLIRREHWSVEKSADFAIKCLYYQKRNIETLKKTLPFSYEDLTENPSQTKERIIKFLPELSDISLENEFNAHNFKNEKMKISNLNFEKMKLISHSDLECINSIFKNELNVLSYFNYTLFEG